MALDKLVDSAQLDEDLGDIADAIRTRGGTSSELSFPTGFITAIQNIPSGGGGGEGIVISDAQDAAGGTVRTITAVNIGDATISGSGQLLNGVTAYGADGTKYTGNIASKSSSDLTSNALTVTAPAGYYASNATKTLTDQNLSPENIKKDVSIFNVTGTFEGSGGGTVSVPKSKVNFIDYDGTILYAYTAQEANALTALPANPSHSGLVAQGWNWTLAQIKAQLTAAPNGDVWVGQLYITQSGKTEIDVEFTNDVRLSPTMSIAIDGSVEIDWGDGTTPTTQTGTSITTRLSVQHTYANKGIYTIKINSTSGNFTFHGSSSYTLFYKNTTAAENRVYTNTIKRIRIGQGMTRFGNNAFQYCGSLESITIPNTIVRVNSNAFTYCYSLLSLTIPNGITTWSSSNMCNGCYSLTTISIPADFPIGSASIFSGCYRLKWITIPSGSTGIGANTLGNCITLKEVIIPNTVTTISSTAFSSCYALGSLTISSSVTEIGASAFSYCSGMKEYHFLPTTPPTLDTIAFNNIPSDCVIYVPYSADHSVLNAYKTGTNWATYADYIQEEPQ